MCLVSRAAETHDCAQFIQKHSPAHLNPPFFFGRHSMFYNEYSPRVLPRAPAAHVVVVVIIPGNIFALNATRRAMQGRRWRLLQR